MFEQQQHKIFNRNKRPVFLNIYKKGKVTKKKKKKKKKQSTDKRAKSALSFSFSIQSYYASREG